MHPCSVRQNVRLHWCEIHTACPFELFQRFHQHRSCAWQYGGGGCNWYMCITYMRWNHFIFCTLLTCQPIPVNVVAKKTPACSKEGSCVEIADYWHKVNTLIGSMIMKALCRCRCQLGPRTDTNYQCSETDQTLWGNVSSPSKILWGTLWKLKLKGSIINEEKENPPPSMANDTALNKPVISDNMIRAWDPAGSKPTLFWMSHHVCAVFWHTCALRIQVIKQCIAGCISTPVHPIHLQ